MTIQLSFELSHSLNVRPYTVHNLGVESNTARAYVSSFYTSLASSTILSHDTLSEMREEAATPGGLNEQSLRSLTNGEHFNLAEQVTNSVNVSKLMEY